MELMLIKAISGWVPYLDEAIAHFEKQKLGTVIRANFKVMRNPRFHRKWFALVKFAYDQWDCADEEYKSFERFRKDVIIECGWWHPVAKLNGTVYREHDSISFAKMDEEEFSNLYNKTIDVLIAQVFNGQKTRDEINEVVDAILRFDG